MPPTGIVGALSPSPTHTSIDTPPVYVLVGAVSGGAGAEPGATPCPPPVSYILSLPPPPTHTSIETRPGVVSTVV